MPAHIFSPESYPLDKNFSKPIGFHPTKKRCNTVVGYSISKGEKVKWDQEKYNQLTPVTDKVAEMAANIVSGNQVACYLRGLVGYNQQKIKQIIRRKKRSHM